MVNQASDHVTVGSYVDETRAREAADHLRENDFDDVAVTEVTSGVWQVEVPSDHAQRALHELQPQEQRSMQTHL